MAMAWRAALAVVGVGLAAGGAWAQAMELPVQGVVTTSGGTVAADGAYDVVFRLYDAVDAVQEQERAAVVILSTVVRGQGYVLAVVDTGAGLPEGVAVSALVEPYVTQKKKGTGLGLAIVKKIMEDHGGGLSLGVPEWLRWRPIFKECARDHHGACVVLVFPHTA